MPALSAAAAARADRRAPVVGSPAAPEGTGGPCRGPALGVRVAATGDGDHTNPLTPAPAAN
ncbi:hypothetical protein GCM10023224_01750 [Streptomonospora halophila]|uniref:Uncharacterized protein n=1 Tax=Streptomonospora halophila TaxID=427369 RepID=A0ABP9G2K2_9ACTN